jgi:Asp-tRNA(Asn)/Glu-tRNA(Gln) amidotransferase C subunit|tara:strand:- start:1734 stop:1946 length:213 start_codon:yes stop_codon:yes gene_type:complete
LVIREDMMIEDNKKYRIAELERQKISIEDELQFTTDVKRVIVLEEQLYEIKDTIKKLTEPWGVTDVQSTH